MPTVELWITHDRDADELVFVAEGSWDDVKADLPERCLDVVGVAACQSGRRLSVYTDLPYGDPAMVVELRRESVITNYRSSAVARREETWIVQALA